MRLLFVLPIALLIPFLTPAILQAQIEEPEIRPYDAPRSPLDEGVRNGLSLNVLLNNYGFGIGGQYRRVLRPNLEGYATLRLTGLRDVSEQTFIDFFFGQQVVPNKYQRGLTLPLTIGVRQRMFASHIADNFRFYLSGGLGPVLAFTYPYFEDLNENGYRDDYRDFGIPYAERVYDIFSGIGDGSWHLGLAGEIKMSLDMGRNFARLSSIEFGYLFYYFDPGLQLMQPNQPVWRDNIVPGDIPFEFTDPDDVLRTIVMEPFFDPQRFFGTPQISFIFGRMW